MGNGDILDSIVCWCSIISCEVLSHIFSWVICPQILTVGSKDILSCIQIGINYFLYFYRIVGVFYSGGNVDRCLESEYIH